jgi:hypothetical protein
MVVAAACVPSDDDACVPDLYWAGSSNGPLFGVAIGLPMQINFSLAMDQTSGVLDVEQWDGAAWQPLPPSAGTPGCQAASPIWNQEYGFEWYPNTFDTCTMANRHWPEGKYFRWIGKDFRSAASVGGCVMNNAKHSYVYFDTCRFDSQDHCSGPVPPDYK